MKIISELKAKKVSSQTTIVDSYEVGDNMEIRHYKIQDSSLSDLEPTEKWEYSFNGIKGKKIFSNEEELILHLQSLNSRKLKLNSLTLNDLKNYFDGSEISLSDFKQLEKHSLVKKVLPSKNSCKTLVLSNDNEIYITIDKKSKNIF